MTYDPERHHRRSIRLRGYDYTQPGAYFVTICTENRVCFFGTVENGYMQLNSLGHLVVEYWQGLPRHFPNVELGAFVVMPNHVHFILWLKPVGAQLNCAPTAPTTAQLNCAPTVRAQLNCAPTAPTTPIGKPFRVDNQHPTLGQVIRAFKAATTRLIHRAGYEEFAWQRNYYEHIIRDEDELQRISRYILENPANWVADRENPGQR